MTNTLQEIANILTLNIYNTDSFGILDGKMGAMLFYYNYGRFTKNKFYTDIADELFNSVYESLNKTRNVSFDQGITGIAWGTRYLIRNKFVNGNPEDILFDIENILFKNYINDFQTQIPLSTMGIYLQSLIEDNSDLEKVNGLIDALLLKYEYYFLCYPSVAHKPITYINSILFLLSSLEKKENYRSRVERIIFKVLLYIYDLDNLHFNDKSDLKTLYNLLSSLNFTSDEKIAVLKEISNYNELYHIEEIIRYLWQNIIYFPNEIIKLNLDDLKLFLNENYTFLPKENSLSLYNGLASIGLALMKPANHIDV